MDFKQRERRGYVVTFMDATFWALTDSDPEACVFGASIICVDALVRLIPGKSNFRIQDSNIFLACSLSLSFGVMVSPHSSRLLHVQSCATAN